MNKPLALLVAASLAVPALRAGEWPMWGGTPSRNMVAVAQGIPDDIHSGKFIPKTETIDPKTTKSGTEKPTLVVSASYDEGKFERVRFGQVGDAVYGMRDGEAGAVKAAPVEAPKAEKAAAAVRKATAGLNVHIVLEPGRYLVAEAALTN